jgi:8-oxo-dGTP pyrophosphatase MutT (NUDIX family)
MISSLSSIQNNIISKLKNSKSLRYSELQPKDIPNDLFNYHLQHLVKKELIIKNPKGYSLSERGIRYVADPYPNNNVVSSLFKVNVITIVSRVRNGKIEILNQVRKSNPSFGKVGVMGGVVLKGELIEDAAKRKFKQETGLDAEFKHIGTERRIMYKNGELFSDLLFPIMYSSKCTGELLVDSDFGHNMWVSINQAIKSESGEFDSIRSINIVLKAIKNNKIKNLPIFFKEEIQSDNIENNKNSILSTE